MDLVQRATRAALADDVAAIEPAPIPIDTLHLLTIQRLPASSSWELYDNGDFYASYGSRAVAAEGVMCLVNRHGGRAVVALDDQNTIAARAQRVADFGSFIPTMAGNEWIAYDKTGAELFRLPSVIVEAEVPEAAYTNPDRIHLVNELYAARSKRLRATFHL